MSKASDNMGSADPDVNAIARDQIWTGDGYTKYTFGDNSVLIQSGPREYAMDCNDADSIHKYAAWLGDDEPIEHAEIERLLAAVGCSIAGSSLNLDCPRANDVELAAGVAAAVAALAGVDAREAFRAYCDGDRLGLGARWADAEINALEACCAGWHRIPESARLIL